MSRLFEGDREGFLSWVVLDAAGFGAKLPIMEDALWDLYHAIWDDMKTDPLVPDLDGDGLELSALTSVAPKFDMDNDGFAEPTGWVRGGAQFPSRCLWPGAPYPQVRATAA